MKLKFSFLTIFFLFISVIYMSGCSGGGSSDTESATVTINSSNGDGANITIYSYNQDGSKKYDEISDKLSGTSISKSVKMYKNGGYILLNITKSGYEDLSKKVIFSNPHNISIDMTLSPVQSQSIVPVNDSTVTISSTGKKVLKIALIKKDDGKKVIATGKKIRSLNGIPEYTMEIPLNAIPKGTKALKVGLSSFDPKKDADKFPGDYIDENGNKLISVGFNFVDIRDAETGKRIFDENKKPSTTASVDYRITRWINDSVCDNLQGDFCTSSPDLNAACEHLSADEINGYNIPFYRYEWTTGTWQLIGVGTIDRNNDGNIDGNDAVDSSFDAIQQCKDNYGFNAIILIDNPNFTYCNLDYPVVNPPVKLCLIKKFKDKDGNPYPYVSVWLSDDDDLQSFLYSSFGTPDSTGTIKLETWNIRDDGDKTATLYYQYTKKIDGDFLTITKSELVSLGEDPDCTSKENTIDLTEDLCKVQGTLQYTDGTPAVGIWINIKSQDELTFIFTSTDQEGKFSATVPCETLMYVYTGLDQLGGIDEGEEEVGLLPDAKFKANGIVDYDEEKDEPHPGVYKYLVTLNTIQKSLPRYALYIFKNGNGTIISNPAGIDCGLECIALFEKGTSVELTATPDTDYRFSGWSGDCSSCTDSTCTVIINNYTVCTATFSPIGNTPPTINSFTATPTTGDAPLDVTFNWNVSDSNGDTLTCKLDVDNDGTYDYTINDCANNTFQVHRYDNAGTYTAKLTVEDGNGGVNSGTVTIVVNTSNTPPTINSFTATPTTGDAPLDVTFNWNVSDSDGDTLTCKLDVDNDGTDDYTINDCANNTSQSHTYNNTGIYTAKLTVEDGNGHSAYKTVSITVTGGSTSVNMNGVWEGSYQGNNGTIGQICVELNQTDNNLTGELYIQGRGHVGSVTGTLSGNNIQFGIAAGVQYTGTVSSDGNSANGTYDENNDGTDDGTWQVTRSSKTNCGWVSSDIGNDILDEAGILYFSNIITEISTITVNNNGTTENDWPAVIIEYVDTLASTSIPYIVTEKPDRTIVFKAYYSNTDDTTYAGLKVNSTSTTLLYGGTRAGDIFSNLNFSSTVIYDSGCLDSGYRAKVYKGSGDVSLPNMSLTGISGTRTFGIPSQSGIIAYKIEVSECTPP